MLIILGMKNTSKGLSIRVEARSDKAGSSLIFCRSAHEAVPPLRQEVFPLSLKESSQQGRVQMFQRATHISLRGSNQRRPQEE